MARATYICTGYCHADVCPCTPTICAVDYDTVDGQLVVVEPFSRWDRDGFPLADTNVTPCVHGQLGYPKDGHPVTEDGRQLHLNDHWTDETLHQWADGDTDCVVLPYDNTLDSM